MTQNKYGAEPFTREAVETYRAGQVVAHQCAGRIPHQPDVGRGRIPATEQQVGA